MKTQVRFEGIKPGLKKIRGLDPEANPEIARGALVEMMDLVISTSRRTQLSGPRPRELDRVTGELASSLERNDTGLPRAISGGTPLTWAPVHEFGRGGRLSFFGPAFEAAFPSFPAIYERHWLRSFDRA
jgi:hypothetical protein